MVAALAFHSGCGEWLLLVVASLVRRGLEVLQASVLPCVGSVAVAPGPQWVGGTWTYGLICSLACGIFLDQDRTPVPVLADVLYPLTYQETKIKNIALKL